MKFKIFEAQTASALSMQINKWLEGIPNIQIVSVTQCERPSTTMLVVMIFYWIAPAK